MHLVIRRSHNIALCPVGSLRGRGEGKDDGGGGEGQELHSLWEVVVVSIESAVECGCLFFRREAVCSGACEK